jgi:hypothetical protein
MKEKEKIAFIMDNASIEDLRSWAKFGWIHALIAGQFQRIAPITYDAVEKLVAQQLCGYDKDEIQALADVGHKLVDRLEQLNQELN